MSELLELKDITKIYPNGVKANSRINLSIAAGEIHAIVGENGAGKSTLMKILYGLEQPTEGKIFHNGTPVDIQNPDCAISLGIGMVHQNFMLVPEFTVAENIVLGVEPSKKGILNRKAAIEDVKELSRKFNLDVDPTAKVNDLPVGARQRVEILKALYRKIDILILDEPSAVLTPQETGELFNAIRSLIDKGKTVIFITHKLKEVTAISDRVTVMRKGRIISTIETSAVSEEMLANLMVGRDVLFTVNKTPVEPGEKVVQVSSLSYVSESGNKLLDRVDFSIHAGEILGVAGVQGNGQSELVKVLTGLKPSFEGEYFLNGMDLTNKSALEIRKSGVAHIPEDRLVNGVAVDESIAENLILDYINEKPYCRYGFWLDKRLVTEFANKQISSFNIQKPSVETKVKSLSGGNIQKVILARELSHNPTLLIAAEPTRGLDVGAIESVYTRIINERDKGVAILLVSSELTEILNLSDRIAVIFKGEFVTIQKNSQNLNEEILGAYMMGIKRDLVNDSER